MIKRVLLIIPVLIALIASVAPAAAQGPEPQRVEITADDGAILVGNYYAPSAPAEDGAPAVLLMHQMSSRKEAWIDFAALLLDAGFAVLAVDLRGHGETGGRALWDQAELDVQSWLDWLREQDGIDPERLNIAGASIGANLALRGMANDGHVVTAIALSPGLDYVGVTTEDAITAINLRPVFLVASQLDRESAQAVRVLAGLTVGDTMARIYMLGAHGTGIFMLEDDLMPLMVHWFVTHNE
ncbi:MAG: alpha/beta fold hydrolase [Anaerolineae bacterium]|nr:alpha/beta fold hydrolase [Anaerolineae bacterium]